MASTSDYDPGSIPGWVHFFFFFCLAQFTMYQKPLNDHCPWPSSQINKWHAQNQYSSSLIVIGSGPWFTPLTPANHCRRNEVGLCHPVTLEVPSCILGRFGRCCETLIVYYNIYASFHPVLRVLKRIHYKSPTLSLELITSQSKICLLCLSVYIVKSLMRPRTSSLGRQLKHSFYK
jgi:hypothetical protein